MYVKNPELMPSMQHIALTLHCIPKRRKMYGIVADKPAQQLDVTLPSRQQIPQVLQHTEGFHMPSAFPTSGLR